MHSPGYLRMASLLFVLSASAQVAAADEQTTRVLVDGDVLITEDMYRYEIQRYPENARLQLRSNPGLARREIIDELYRRIKLVEEAERRNLMDDPAVVYEIERGRQIALSQALARQLRSEVQVPDLEQAARERYLGKIDDYRVKEAVRVRHILLRPPEGAVSAEARRAEAEDLLRQLQQGASFTELARAHSGDGSAENGGDIGWIERGQTVEPFDRAAFALQEPNALSGIVATTFGLHLIQLAERREAAVRDFESVKATIVAELTQEYIQKVVEEQMKVITDHSGATAHQEVIEEVVREGLAP